jgi:prepilin-type N-terminal cleavage/methylation domain-containing protein
MRHKRGYTLVELMVALGLFAIVMLLASGAYLMMIGLNRQAQSISNGIDNLSFALETMTRNIRTGTAYSCGAFGGDCTSGASSFSFTNQAGQAVSYTLSGTALQQTVAGVQSLLTDSSVTITSLTFYAFGTKAASQSDYEQSRVTATISGTVSTGPGKPSQSFTIETGATMRGSDL